MGDFKVCGGMNKADVSKLRLVGKRIVSIRETEKLLKRGYFVEHKFSTDSVVGMENDQCFFYDFNLNKITNYNVNLFSDKMERKIFEKIQEVGMLEEAKEYIKKHKDILFTIVILVIVDKLVFKGAFTQKAKDLISGLVGKVEEKKE